MRFIENLQVYDYIKSKPDKPCERLIKLRTLMIKVAEQYDDITSLNESFKWGEPSYQSDIGSLVRIDYKAKTPDKYYIYFICNTRLVETFREIYGDVLQLEGNRAIVLEVDKAFDETIIKHCLSLALRYKKIKHLPMLGT